MQLPHTTVRIDIYERLRGGSDDDDNDNDNDNDDANDDDDNNDLTGAGAVRVAFAEFSLAAVADAHACLLAVPAVDARSRHVIPGAVVYVKR
jgi:hypothetical protein